MDIFSDLVKKTNKGVEYINDDYLIRIADIIVTATKKGKKILFIGNGGSNADAQHIVAEFTGRYRIDRPPIKALAQTNMAEMTAVANNYDYVTATVRFIETWGEEGDILFAISTSGNSENVLKGVELAKHRKMKIITMSGSSGKLAAMADYPIEIRSTETPIIQLGYMMIAHYICEEVEKCLFIDDRKNKLFLN
jgi:D-sedoheptulose 7-phosphate isomerase